MKTMYRVEIIKPHNKYTKDVLARNADDAYHQCITPDDEWRYML